MEARCRGLGRAEAARQLPDVVPAERAIGFWVAALREAFEEAGILLAYGPDGRPVDAASLGGDARARCREDSATFGRLLAELDMVLATDRVAYWAHWITPEERPIRYDTRFFVAADLAGAGCGAGRSRDGGRALDPPGGRAGEAPGAGELVLPLPTQGILASLSEHRDVDALLAAAHGREVRPVRPRIVRDGSGGERILLPAGSRLVLRPGRGAASGRIDRMAIGRRLTLTLALGAVILGPGGRGPRQPGRRSDDGSGAGTPGDARSGLARSRPRDAEGLALHPAEGRPGEGPRGVPEARVLQLPRGAGRAVPVAERPGRAGPELSMMGPLHPPEFFAESIINPSAVVERNRGYAAADGSSKMPSYGSVLTVQETIDLVAYLRQLRPPAASAPGPGGHSGHTTP